MPLVHEEQKLKRETENIFKKYDEISDMRIGIFAIPELNESGKDGTPAAAHVLREDLKLFYEIGTVPERCYEKIKEKDIEFAIFIPEILDKEKQLEKIEHELRHAVQYVKNKDAFYKNELMKTFDDFLKKGKPIIEKYLHLPYEIDARNFSQKNLNNCSIKKYNWVQKTNKLFNEHIEKIRLICEQTEKDECSFVVVGVKDGVKEVSPLCEDDYRCLKQICQKCKESKII